MTDTMNTEINLDKLAAIANQVRSGGLFNVSCDILDWIQEVHTTLARAALAGGGGQADTTAPAAQPVQAGEAVDLPAKGELLTEGQRDKIEAALRKAWPAAFKDAPSKAMGQLIWATEQACFASAARASLAPVSAQQGAAVAQTEDECRKTCNVCWDDNGKPWPCARGKARRAKAAEAADGAMLPLSAGLPSPDEHDRVLVYTEGSDFAGEQYFDIKTEELWELDSDQKKEVAEHATHWMPLPHPGIAPTFGAAKAPAAQADYTVDDSELARKIMLFMGRATTASMEPGADPLRDRLAERLSLWRPAASPASTPEQQQAAQGDLDALVREYGNAPVTGPGRTRRVVMRDIYRLAGEIFAATTAGAATTSEDARDAALSEARTQPAPASAQPADANSSNNSSSSTGAQPDQRESAAEGQDSANNSAEGEKACKNS
jgi:hypothetical protein